MTSRRVDGFLLLLIVAQLAFAAFAVGSDALADELALFRSRARHLRDELSLASYINAIAAPVT